MSFGHVNESGEREEFDTGSVRDTRKGKGRYDLISTHGLRRLAVHYENGAVTYGDDNWQKGQPVSRFLDSAMRHINQYRAGDRSEDHLSAVSWNALAAVHMEEEVAAGRLPATLCDVPALPPVGPGCHDVSDLYDTDPVADPPPDVCAVCGQGVQGPGWRCSVCLSWFHSLCGPISTPCPVCEPSGEPEQPSEETEHARCRTCEARGVAVDGATCGQLWHIECKGDRTHSSTGSFPTPDRAWDRWDTINAKETADASN